MTRYAIDVATALRLLEDDAVLPAEHALVAPKVLQSQVLALVYGQVARGERAADEARLLLERLAALKVRLLGDRVSRAVAWRVAERLGWAELGPAEYLAVAQLQADALVAGDEDLARAAEGLVPTASYDALVAPGPAPA